MYNITNVHVKKKQTFSKKKTVCYNIQLKAKGDLYLPSHCTFFGELPKDDLLLGMLLFVLLATCLDEERVRCHPSSWLRIFSSRHIVPLQTLSVILLKIILRQLYLVLKPKQTELQCKLLPRKITGMLIEMFPSNNRKFLSLYVKARV